MGDFRLYEYVLDELESLRAIVETKSELEPAARQIHDAIWIIMAIHSERFIDDPDIPLEYLEDPMADVM